MIPDKRELRQYCSRWCPNSIRSSLICSHGINVARLVVFRGGEFWQPSPFHCHGINKIANTHSCSLYWRSTVKTVTMSSDSHCWGCSPGTLSMSQVSANLLNGPLASYTKLRVAHARGMPGTFSRPPLNSDPNMHHATCVTHVPWCTSGSLTSGFLWSQWRGKRSRHSRSMRNPKFNLSGKRPIPKTKPKREKIVVPILATRVASPILYCPNYSIIYHCYVILTS